MLPDTAVSYVILVIAAYLTSLQIESQVTKFTSRQKNSHQLAHVDEMAKAFEGTHTQLMVQ